MKRGGKKRGSQAETVAPETKEPLRGDAAWRATKKEIADRNEAAYARGRRDRAVRNAASVKRRSEQERETNARTPRSSAR